MSLLAEGDEARGRSPLYQESLERAIDEDQLRTLDVKMAVAKDPAERRAVVAQLIGFPGRAIDRVLAAELLGAWAATSPTDGLPQYLLGRHFYNSGNFEEARDRLEQRGSRRADHERPGADRGRKRLRVVGACALGDVAGAERWQAVYAGHPTLSTARAEAARRFVERCKATARAEP